MSARKKSSRGSRKARNRRLLLEPLEPRFLLVTLADLQVTPNEIFVGETVALTGSIKDGIGPYTLEVRWEEHLAVEKHGLPADTTNISLTHQYEKPTQGIADGTFKIDVTLTDVGASEVQIERVSLPTQEGVTGLVRPALSGNGRFVAFTTLGQLVGADQDDLADVYVRDLDDPGGLPMLVSVGSGPGLDETCSYPSISDDGRYVAFMAGAHVYVHDRESSQTNLVAKTAGGDPATGDRPQISGDGQYVVFQGQGDIVGQSANQSIYVSERNGSSTKLVSLDLDGTPALTYAPKISGDGSYVAFVASIHGLVPGNHPTTKMGVFLKQVDGETMHVSAAPDGSLYRRASYVPSIALSEDGRYVAWELQDGLRDGGSVIDPIGIYVYDRETKTNELVTGGAGVSSFMAYGPTISADGRFVAFSTSFNVTMVSRKNFQDIYVRDMVDDEYVHVSVTQTQDMSANGSAAISNDGRRIAFLSSLGGLIPEDTNDAGDIYLATVPDPPFSDDLPIKVKKANIVVTIPTDQPDPDTSDGVCDVFPAIPSEQCTLRAAIMEANERVGKDTITFAIPNGGGVPLIRPQSPLPDVLQPAVIDATTQSGGKVELVAFDAGSGANGLTITGGDTRVEGFVINLAPQYGILLKNRGGNVIRENFIGTDKTGTTDRDGNVRLGNREGGILIDGVANNTIVDNVISGNAYFGVHIRGEKATGNKLEDNYIGTDVTGKTSLGNSGEGVRIENAPKNTVGGTGQVAGNIISGNNGTGVFIEGEKATDNILQGNYIGTNPTGDPNLANYDAGVTIREASNNTVGGTTEAERNVISGNGTHGVAIVGGQFGATENKIFGNYIGINPLTEWDLGNGQHGVFISDAAFNYIGSPTGTTSGGPCTGACNVISGNGDGPMGGYGVRILGSDATWNSLRGNYIGPDAAGVNFVRPYGSDYSGNRSGGVQIDGGSYNFIGGQGASTGKALSGEGNLISGNSGDGISIKGKTAKTNYVSGNVIGAEVKCVERLENKGNGVKIEDASGNMIGGPFERERNVISGNQLNGVEIKGMSAENNKIWGNFIGVNATGKQDLGNGGDGVRIDGAPNNTVGGSTEAVGQPPGNVISANHQVGVHIKGPDAPNNKLHGNLIGTELAGKVVRENALGGVKVSGASNNTIGGGTPLLRNVISVKRWSFGVRLEAAIRIEESPFDVRIEGHATKNRVEGNYIGTDITGHWDIDDLRGGTGVHIIRASHNTIGGSVSVPGQPPGNVVSGNSVGVTIQASDNNHVQGNLIGTDCDGKNSIANGYGVGVGDGASDNVIGGTSSKFRNVISGNDSFGVVIQGPAPKNRVEGNYIGTKLNGIEGLSNDKAGVQITTAWTNTIGGNGPEARNLISGNDGPGVQIVSGGDNKVQGNFIGTKIDGTSPLGNSIGISLLSPLGAPPTNANLIGGTGSGEGNTIAFNKKDGVKLGKLDKALKTGNPVVGNVIFENDDLGIDLEGGSQDANGVSANDLFDHDDGPNGLQNYPVITAAAKSSDSVMVRGYLDSGPNTRYRIELFASQKCDPSGHGEGQEFLGFRRVTTDSTGEYRFAFSGKTANPFVTATATKLDGSGKPQGTSEFSKCFAFEQDDDGDGVSNREEDENGPDSNGDGIPDKQQWLIASLPNVTVTAEPGTKLSEVATVGIPDPANAPPGVLPIGLVQFKMKDLPHNGETQARIKPPPNTDFNSYYKYSDALGWYEWLYNPATGVGAELFPDLDEIILHFRDGELGDNDAIANGEIDDPGGPVLVTTGSISGFVYADVNNNGIKEAHELGLPNVPVTATGPVTVTVTTDANGRYEITDLPVGQYTITEMQPSAFNDGIDTPGPAFQGEAENDGFRDVAVQHAIESASYDFAERGLKGEFVSLWHFMNSTPSADQLVLDLIDGMGFGSFRAASNGTFTADAEAEGLSSIELYTSDMIPVSIASAGGPLSAQVAEGESYVLLVTGADGQVDLQTAIEPFVAVFLTNPNNPLDVDANGVTTPLDVLVLINSLNAGLAAVGSQVYYVDVNNDRQLTPLDVLTVVNHLSANTNQSPANTGEGEPSRQFEIPLDPEEWPRAAGDMRLCVGLPTPHAGLTEGLPSPLVDVDSRGNNATRSPDDDAPFGSTLSLNETARCSRDLSDIHVSSDADGASVTRLELESALSEFADDVADIWSNDFAQQ